MDAPLRGFYQAGRLFFDERERDIRSMTIAVIIINKSPFHIFACNTDPDNGCLKYFFALKKHSNIAFRSTLIRPAKAIDVCKVEQPFVQLNIRTV